MARPKLTWTPINVSVSAPAIKKAHQQFLDAKAAMAKAVEEVHVKQFGPLAAGSAIKIGTMYDGLSYTVVQAGSAGGNAIALTGTAAK